MNSVMSFADFESFVGQFVVTVEFEGYVPEVVVIFCVFVINAGWWGVVPSPYRQGVDFQLGLRKDGPPRPWMPDD